MRASPPAPARRIALRWYIVLLVAGALLPMIAFAAAIIFRFTSEERAAEERRLTLSARLLANAVDRELITTIRILEGMARSEHLDRGDLEGFHLEARRVHETQPLWITVILLTPDSKPIVNTLLPFGQPLPPVVEPASVLRTVETRQPTIGSIARGRVDIQWGIPIRVPVMREGMVKYVLTAVISPEAVGNVVGHEPLPDEWARGVLDDGGVIIARSRDREKYIGQPARPATLSLVREKPEGFFRDLSREQQDVYIAFARAPASGWVATVVVPLEVVDRPLRRSMLALSSAGLLVLLVSGAGAFFVARRLSRGITSASRAAESLAHGERPHVEPSSIEEVAQLGDALARSADLLARRERERDELLAHAEDARSKAESESRAKDEFLAMLGHELRNPLSPIVTALELQKLRGQGGTREHGVIERQVRHLIRLVEDLLDMARISRGKIELRREPLDIGTLVARAIEMVNPLLTQREHTLSVDVQPGLVVNGDPVRLAQVMTNLLTNAAKYTNKGGHIEVKARREREEIVLDVTDNGQGLSAELLPRVFDLFVQAPRSPDRSEGGLGIGLTLVRGLVQLHGGSVEAQSGGLGKGSTFVVRLPAFRDAELRADIAERNGLPLAAERSLRVLVVDDNIDAAQLLADFLSSRGHTVSIAHDGQEALDSLVRRPPDVAVLDIGLPNLDGYTVATRAREELGAATPIFVAVTGYGQESDRARSLEAGFQSHFVKPVDPLSLSSTFEELASRRGMTTGS